MNTPGQHRDNYDDEVLPQLEDRLLDDLAGELIRLSTQLDRHLSTGAVPTAEQQRQWVVALDSMIDRLAALGRPSEAVQAEADYYRQVVDAGQTVERVLSSHRLPRGGRHDGDPTQAGQPPR